MADGPTTKQIHNVVEKLRQENPDNFKSGWRNFFQSIIADEQFAEKLEGEKTVRFTRYERFEAPEETEKWAPRPPGPEIRVRAAPDACLED